MGNTILINPYLIFVGGKPCGVGVDRCAFDKQGWWCGLVPHFEIQLMFTLWYSECLGLSELQFTIQHEIELSFTCNGNRLLPIEVELTGELHRHIV